jgi:MFS family permease
MPFLPTSRRRRSGDPVSVLRLAFYTTGFVVGPLTAMALMRASGDNFGLVFWIAVIPAALAIVVLVIALKEPPRRTTLPPPRVRFRRGDFAGFPPPFWWAVAVASALSLARFSNAFLILKTHDIGIDAAFVPMALVLMHLVYAGAAYPFGVLADHFDRRAQLGMGATVLVVADIVLLYADTVWAIGIGVALWGLQLAVTQGLLPASVADAAPEHLRGTAFGIYELAVGLATFVASAAAGLLWTLVGPALTFGVSAGVAAGVVLLLFLRPMPRAG